MDRIFTTEGLKEGENIILLQNSKEYIYTVKRIFNKINLDLERGGILYSNVSLTRDGIFKRC